MKMSTYFVMLKRKKEAWQMDAKCEILDNVTAAVTGIITGTALEKLKEVLLAELAKYEVQERCTEIIVRDGSAEGLLRKFLATKRIEGKSENTIRYYNDVIGTFVNRLDRRLYEVTAFDLRLYLSLYKEERKVNNRTLENIRKVLSSFFGWLYDEEFIPHNPCRAVKQIKYDKVIRKPFSGEDMEKLKNACTNARDLALVHFLYATGCRVSEVVSVDTADVDFLNRELVVYGKGGKERTVYLTQVATMYLKTYISGRRDNSKALFVGKGSKRIQKNAIESLLKRLGRRAGVENVHPHRFRRTLATDLIDRGAALQDVQRILGHEDIRTTQVYVYVQQRNVKNTYERYAS